MLLLEGNETKACSFDGPDWALGPIYVRSTTGLLGRALLFQFDGPFAAARTVSVHPQ